MKGKLLLFGGIGLGAGLMYALDPDRGKRRRARLRDKAAHAMNRASDDLSKASRDMSNRARGLVAEARTLFKSEQVFDDVLAARVRSRLGRAVSHPHALEVQASEGRVTLRGPVLAREVDRLLCRVSRVRGVREVENQLEVHEQAGDVPGLQGGRERKDVRFDLLKPNWSPATRLVVSAGGGALALYGARRRGVLGSALNALGFSALTRGLTNIESKRLIGVGDGRHAVEIQKTISINAPIERVFEFWSHPENFPQFMSHVREVEDLGDARYRWKVDGPAGVPVEWEAVVTQIAPKEVLAWKSVEGSTVEQSGVTRFRQNADGSTRLDIKMSYNPPAGYVGHTVAELFGRDPKSEMDDDLMRMKTFLETGVRAHDAAQTGVVSAPNHASC